MSAVVVEKTSGTLTAGKMPVVKERPGLDGKDSLAPVGDFDAIYSIRH